MPGIIGVFKNGWILSSWKPFVPIVLLNPFMLAPSRFANIYFAAFTRTHTNTTPSYFRGSTGSLGRTKCDLSVVSDLKTDWTPFCGKKRRCFDVAGSLSDACRFLDFVMLVTNKLGYPLETWTEAKCVFSGRVSKKTKLPMLRKCCKISIKSLSRSWA